MKIGRKEQWLGSIDAELKEGIFRTLLTSEKAVIDARLEELKVRLLHLDLIYKPYAYLAIA